MLIFIDGFIRLRHLRQSIDKYLLNTCPLVCFMYQLMSIYHLMIFLLSSSLLLFCFYYSVSIILLLSLSYMSILSLSDLHSFIRLKHGIGDSRCSIFYFAKP